MAFKPQSTFVIKNGKEFQIALKNIGKGANRGLQRIAQKVVTELKKEVIEQNLIWNWDLLDGIRMEADMGGTKGISYNILMPEEGRFVDDMEPHYVTPYPWRPIHDWANDKMYQGAGKLPRIWVEPHPFINKALDNSAKNRSVIRKEMVEAIKNEIKFQKK